MQNEVKSGVAYGTWPTFIIWGL